MRVITVCLEKVLTQKDDKISIPIQYKKVRDLAIKYIKKET